MRTRKARSSRGFARAASKARAARCSGVARAAAVLSEAVGAQAPIEQNNRHAKPKNAAIELNFGLGICQFLIQTHHGRQNVSRSTSRIHERPIGIGEESPGGFSWERHSPEW